MSQPSTPAKSPIHPPAAPEQPKGAFKNPAYPQRVHAHERPFWQDVLKSCDERIAQARKKLDVLGQSPQRPMFDRLYTQMTGARDQVADAVRRLPGEVGDLYAEDLHRLEEAVAALDRVIRVWESS